MLEDGTTTGMSYEVGSGELMEGLDDAVRGLSADGSATFTTPLRAGEHAGEEAEVTVTVRSVKAKELPELDDEFASTASEFDTLEELRADVRSRLGGARSSSRARRPATSWSSTCWRPSRCRSRRTSSSARSSSATSRWRTTSGRPAWTSTATCRSPAPRAARTTTPTSSTQIEQQVKTQFILDAIADAREITVDNDDLSAQIIAQAQRSRVAPEQYAQQLQQSGNIAEFVADVRRTKALAQLLEQTTITDASGNVVDLEALRPQTVRPARTPTRPTTPPTRSCPTTRRSPPRPSPPRPRRAPARTPDEGSSPGLIHPARTRDAVPPPPGRGGVVRSRLRRDPVCAHGEHRPAGDCLPPVPR